MGFSPNGKMAGPSEAVVGVVEEKKSDQGKILKVMHSWLFCFADIFV